MNKQDILGYVIIFFLLSICAYIYYDASGFQLKCIVSSVDGNKYCVRDRKQLQNAADLLASVTDKCKKLVEYLTQKYEKGENDVVDRLSAGFNPQKIIETLPTSTYTAYSENKGEKLAFCLNRKKEDNNDLIDESTLTFVSIHELAHIGTKSIGHKTDFWENFKFLLENAKEAGIHNPENYKEKPREYCGMKIKDNPYYDM
jgi:hypothetical protein